MADSGIFTKYNLTTSNCPAFRALSVYAKALYPKLKLEWRPPPYNNNGAIRLSVKQAGEFLRCSPVTARKAFHDLQQKGFIRVNQIALLGTEGQAIGHCYELTENPMPTTEKPRMLFMEWKADAEFDVTLAQVNNPKGNNGKRKSPTYDIGNPNTSRMLKKEKPNIHDRLSPHNSGHNHPFPNIASMSSLGNLKGKHPICETERAAIEMVANSKGLCGKANGVLRVVAQ